MRWRYTFTLSLLTVGSCNGGQSGDPGLSQGQLGGNIVPQATECQVLQRGPNTSSPSVFQCALTSGSLVDPAAPDAPLSATSPDWTCNCAGSLREAQAERCDEALLLACDVDVRAPQPCEGPSGQCFPENAAGRSWDCQCSPDSVFANVEMRGIDSPSCHEALSAACEESCSDAFGSCVGSPEDYTCVCDGPGAGLGESAPRGPVLSHGATCSGAVGEVCGGECETFAGHCVLEDGKYTCDCKDAASASVAVSKLEGVPAVVGGALCDAALSRVCGVVDRAQDCSSSNGVWTAQCEGLAYVIATEAPAPNVFPFSCTCSEESAEDAASTRHSLEAANCSVALRESCPGAVRPGSDPDGPTLDFGHLCESDDDCSGKDCYVPGTKRDAICSQHCETDDDCPAFAQCASMFGSKHCFVTCTNDDECRQLNSAVENPLHCLAEPVLDITHDGVCVQESEP